VTEVERICLAALDRPAEERAAFLDDACRGDDALRHEIESLLAHASPAEQFIEQPAVAGAGALAGLSGLSLGQRLGPYQIIAKLGTGGMGEVYRAHDTQLGREVAIKILPVVFAMDPDRLARFEREARTLASLNHPHIAAIYGVEADPSGDGVPRRALVMELIEGPTLAERIAGGPLQTAEALTIARQIAEALEAAHEKGIIHRDLKPANIKVTPDGVVKVLDFGLAKADATPADARHAQADVTNSPTFRTGGTRQGVILGTAAYMSPEQSRGEAVDKRTDIWSFGCVLFEMLAGRSVFAAASVTETLSEVLKTEPDWQRLPADTPEGVRRLLRRCLTKDRARRLADIRDAQLDLDEAPDDASHPTKGKSRDVSLRWAIAVISAVIAIAALTWIVSTMRKEETAQPRFSRLSIPLSGAAAIAGDVTITPDGTRVVYVGNKGTQIFVRPLDRIDPTPIATATAPLNSVFVSTDGQWVGFGEGGRMKRVAINEGPVEQILDTGGSDATWAPDNTIIFVSLLKPGLQRVSVSGGDPEELTRPDPSRGELAGSGARPRDSDAQNSGAGWQSRSIRPGWAWLGGDAR
jgi:serine/threonine-protein kinase